MNSLRAAANNRESKFDFYVGWVQGLKDNEAVCALFSSRPEEAVLELHGLAKKDEAKRGFRLEECSRCGKKNQPDSVRCGFCGFILDRRLTEEMEQKVLERDLEIQSRLQRLDQTINSLLNNQAKT